MAGGRVFPLSQGAYGPVCRNGVRFAITQFLACADGANTVGDHQSIGCAQTAQSNTEEK
jgi:hypothetical protein